MSQKYNEWYAFHHDNPHVYDFICQYADEAIRAGHKQYAMATIWELIRWEVTVRTTHTEFALPNNHRAYYSRYWLANHPQHPGFFRTAELRSVRGGAVDRYGRSIPAT
jgi:hypothetical protein